MGADDTVSVLEQIVELRGRAPKMIRCDNGPEFISQSLRDWCRFNHAGTGYIEPGAPWQNPFVESFNGHLRRELLEMESFNTLFEAQLLLDDWRLEYNHYRPHQSLNYMTPAEYARREGPTTNQNSHNDWTEERGPVTLGCRSSSARPESPM